MSDIDPGPVIPEREFLGLDTSDRMEATFATLRETAANSIARMDAAETAADMLVTLYRTGMLREAVEGWEKAR